MNRSYLCFDALHGVSEEDGRGGVGGTHLGLWTLESRKEGGVKKGRLVEPETRGHVTCHPEVGVLQKQSGQT